MVSERFYHQPSFKVLVILILITSIMGSLFYVNRDDEPKVLEKPSSKPSIKIIEPTSGEQLSGMVTVKGIVSDVTPATVRVTVGNIKPLTASGLDNWEISLDTTLLPNGRYDLTAKVFENSTEMASHSISIRIKNIHVNIIPECSITQPYNGQIVRDLLNIKGSAHDTDGQVEYAEWRVPGYSDWETAKGRELWSDQLDTTGLSDGDHVLEARTSDGFDHSEIARAVFVVEHPPPEWVPPVCSISYPLRDSDLKGTVIISGTAKVMEPEEDIEEVYVKIGDSGEWLSANGTVEWEYKWHTKTLPNGQVTLFAKCRDTIGYSEPAAVTVNIVNSETPNQPPDVSILYPNEGTELWEIVTVRGTATDSDGSVEKVFVGLDLTQTYPPWPGSETDWIHAQGTYDWSLTLDLNGLDEGKHEIAACAWDGTDFSTIEVCQVLLTRPPPVILPHVDIITPEEQESIAYFVNVTGVARDEVSQVRSIEVSFSEGPWLPAVIGSGDASSEPISPDDVGWYYILDLRNIQNGDHSLKARASNTEGSTSKDAMVNFTLDTPDPLFDPLVVEGIETIVIGKNIAQAGVVFGPVLYNHDIDLKVNWSAGTGLVLEIPDAQFYDLALFSCSVATGFWDGPDTVLFVPDHAWALKASLLASLVNAPIVVTEGLSTEAIEQVTGDLMMTMDRTMFCGEDLPSNLPSPCGLHLATDSELWNRTISEAVKRGILIDYMIVTNPDDIKDDDRGVRSISTLAPVLSAHYNGIILPATATGGKIDALIEKTYGIFSERGIEMEYLCLLGDDVHIPFISGSKAGHSAPSDEYYADLDDDTESRELANGRVLGRSVEEVSRYLHRITHYSEYLATSIKPGLPLPALGPFWNNNAVIFCGIAAEFAYDSEIATRRVLMANGSFNTKDDTSEAHSVPPNTGAIMRDFSRSNFIAINADHGEPDSTMTFEAHDLPQMYPGVCFAVSCSLGRIDGISIESSITYAMLANGMNAYLGSTRTTYGTFMNSLPDYQPEAAPGLCYLFFEHMLRSNLTTGEAFRRACNDLNEHGVENINPYITLEYVLYGDPGFNPYDPANEGGIINTTETKSERENKVNGCSSHRRDIAKPGLTGSRSQSKTGTSMEIVHDPIALKTAKPKKISIQCVEKEYQILRRTNFSSSYLSLKQNLLPRTKNCHL